MEETPFVAQRHGSQAASYERSLCSSGFASAVNIFCLTNLDDPNSQFIILD